MLDTSWKLALKNAASTPARKITRDILALNSAFGRLAASSSSAQAVLSRVAPAGTAVQIRGVTSAIREQTKALREQAGVAGRRSPGTRRAPAATPSGRVALGNGFAQRALALQFAYRSRQGAQEVQQTQRNRASELRAHQSYFQRLSRMTQASFRENARLSAQARRDSARSHADRMRAVQATRETTNGMLGQLAGGALGAVTAVAGIAAAFAGVGASAAQAVIEVAAFRESSLVALEAVLGSSQAAGRQFRNAITVANQTPLDTQDVIRQTQSFAVAGFGEREIAPLIAASADLGAAFGQRSSEGFALALSQIRATGTLQGQELLQLTNANVSRMAVLDSIARQMNLGQGDVGRRAAMTAISQRRVSSGVGEQAALDAVRGRLDQGGQLGSFARRQSETLTGAISNARNAIFNLLIGIDFANIPGIQQFKDAILTVTRALSDGSPAALAIRGAISGAANVVGRFMASIVTPDNIRAGFEFVQSAFQRVQNFAKAAWPVVRSFIDGLGPGFMAGVAPLRALFGQLTKGGGPSQETLDRIARSARGLGEGLGMLAGAAATFIGTIGTLSLVWGSAVSLFTGAAIEKAFPFAKIFSGLGSQMVSGLIAGITGSIGRVRESVSLLGNTAVTSIQETLGIHSPSRVFADLVGAQIPAGIAQGVTGNSAVANDAVSGIVNPRAPQLGGGGASINLTINVEGASQPAETARVIRAEIEDALGAIFGQMAEAGA